MSDIVDFIKQNPQAKKLRLANLGLNTTDFCNIMAVCQNVRSIDLRGNRITDVFFGLCHFQSNCLESLDLRGNPIADMTWLERLVRGTRTLVNLWCDTPTPEMIIALRRNRLYAMKIANSRNGALCLLATCGLRLGVPKDVALIMAKMFFLQEKNGALDEWLNS